VRVLSDKGSLADRKHANHVREDNVGQYAFSEAFGAAAVPGGILRRYQRGYLRSRYFIDG
jgi:hypothetical protein